MPTIAMFYGILIRMFFKDNEKHSLPHIHADYQGQVNCRQTSTSLSLPGLKFTGMIFLQTGSWQCMARNPLLSKDLTNENKRVDS